MFRIKSIHSKSSGLSQSPVTTQQQDQPSGHQLETPIDITNLQWPELDETEMHLQKTTFQNDDFGRYIFALQLNRMIDNSKSITENQSLSVAIDASWGMGKTQFIHMWRNMLLEEEVSKKWKAVYYNAWKYDDYSDAFAPMVCTICKESITNEQVSKKVLAATTKILKISAVGLTTLACAAFPVLLPFASLGKTAVDYLSEKSDTDLFSNFNQRELAKKEFRDSLKDLIGDNDKLIIIVDELDRCRPTFAIETLEVMKHFFNVDKVIFVFSLDIQQLSKSIATVYGQNMDASGYLSRFFECQLRLPLPTEQQICEMSGFGNEAYPYFLATCRTLKVSIREIKALLRLTKQFEATTKMGNLKKHYFDKVNAGNCFFFFLFALKLKDPECYANLTRNDVNPDNKYMSVARISVLFQFLYDIRDLDILHARQKIQERLNRNNRDSKTGFESLLISFFVEETSDSDCFNMPFLQWLERRVEIFMGEDVSQIENGKVLVL